MRTRFILDYNSETSYIKPSNSIELSAREVVNEAGGWYYEQSMTDLIIQNRWDSAGYARLQSARGDNSCGTLYLTLEVFVSNSWHQKFKGYFSVKDCEFDDDLCYVKIKVTEDSVYNCIQKNWERDFNILSLPNIQETVIKGGIGATGNAYPIRFFIYYSGTMPSRSVFVGSKMQPDSPFHFWNFYAQVYAFTDCIGGVAQEPDDVLPWINRTFELTGNQCDSNGVTEWIQWPLSDPPVSSSDFDLELGTITGAAQHFNHSEVIGDAFGGGNYSIVWNAADVVIPNGRRLHDVMDALLADACSEIENVRSFAFGLNINDVTEGERVNPVLHQITDVKYNEADQPASRANITLKKLLTEMHKLMLIRWRVKNVGALGLTLVWDPWNSTEIIGGVDTRFANIKGFNRITFDKSGKAGIKKFSTPAQADIDFVGKNITFTQPCSTSDTEEVSTELLCADIVFIRQFPDDTPNDAIVIVSADADGVIYMEDGALSGVPKLNGAFSWANLHEEFHVLEVYTRDYNLNGTDRFDTFNGILPDREVKIICKNCNLDIDPFKQFTLPMGNGFVSEMRTSMQTGDCEITFKVRAT